MEENREIDRTEKIEEDREIGGGNSLIFWYSENRLDYIPLCHINTVHINISESELDDFLANW